MICLGSLILPESGYASSVKYIQQYRWTERDNRSRVTKKLKVKPTTSASVLTCICIKTNINIEFIRKFALVSGIWYVHSIIAWLRDSGEWYCIHDAGFILVAILLGLAISLINTKETFSCFEINTCVPRILPALCLTINFSTKGKTAPQIKGLSLFCVTQSSFHRLLRQGRFHSFKHNLRVSAKKQRTLTFLKLLPFFTIRYNFYEVLQLCHVAKQSSTCVTKPRPKM